MVWIVTPEQKQEAQAKFQEYVNTTGKQDVKGFKEFLNRQQVESQQNRLGRNSRS